MICAHCSAVVIAAGDDVVEWTHEETGSEWCSSDGGPLDGELAEPVEEPLDVVVRGWNRAIDARNRGPATCQCPICDDRHDSDAEHEPDSLAAIVRCECPSCGWHHRAPGPAPSWRSA